jgi:hypothetical protein
MNSYLKFVGIFSAVITVFGCLTALFSLRIDFVLGGILALGGCFAVYYVGCLREDNEIMKKEIESITKALKRIDEQNTGIKKSVAEEEIERLEKLRKDNFFTN